MTARRPGVIGRMIRLGSLACVLFGLLAVPAGATARAAGVVSSQESLPLYQVAGTAVALLPFSDGSYDVVTSTGGVYSFGGAPFFGSAASLDLAAPVISAAVTPDGAGYWLVARDGGVFSYGDAQFFGSMGGKPLNSPVIALAPTPTGKGYWLVAGDGGVFSFGDAQFFGSMGGKPLDKPVIGMAPSPADNGYWLFASDGGVFSFGRTQFYGSTGGEPLDAPIVAMTAAVGGTGYRLVASDGGVFSFNTPFYGSLAGQALSAPIDATAGTPDGGGYWLLGGDGAIYTFGDAGYEGRTVPPPPPPPPVSPAPVTSPPPSAPVPGYVEGKVTAVGDSVMLDYQTALEQDIPGIDVQAAVSEQWAAGESELQELKSEGQLGTVVIVALSTNGPISSTDFAGMMSILSGASRVVIVNIHVDQPWQNPNNAVLAAGVQHYSNTVLADWYDLAQQNPGWLYGTGTHMPINGPGAQAVAELVAHKA